MIFSLQCITRKRTKYLKNCHYLTWFLGLVRRQFNVHVVSLMFSVSMHSQTLRKMSVNIEIVGMLSFDVCLLLVRSS